MRDLTRRRVSPFTDLIANMSISGCRVRLPRILPRPDQISSLFTHWTLYSIVLIFDLLCTHFLFFPFLCYRPIAEAMREYSLGGLTTIGRA